MTRSLDLLAEEIAAGAVGTAGLGASAEAPAGREPVQARNADALVAVADAALASPGAARSGGDRFQVVVHVDADALTGTAASDAEQAHGACGLEHGPALAPETARRLACDASVVRIVERDGRPLSVGRKTRSIPPAIRRALSSRDGGCRFPGCDQHRHVDAHHIHHWAQGGETRLTNLVLLCRHHHRMLHEGGFSVASTAAGLVFRRPDGRSLSVREPQRRAPSALHRGASAEARVEPAHERMDLGYAVDALLDFAPLRASPESAPAGAWAA